MSYISEFYDNCKELHAWREGYELRRAIPRYTHWTGEMAMAFDKLAESATGALTEFVMFYAHYEFQRRMAAIRKVVEHLVTDHIREIFLKK